MSLARRPAAWPAALALAALLGCGGEKPAPLAPPLLPPQILEVHPAARSTHVPYEIDELWARFAEALDSTTVTAANVFLKLDTRRTPIDVRWDGASRRVVVRPRGPLALAETYTLELGPGLRTASGVPLPSLYWWQFTVSGLRHLRTPRPSAGSAAESPYAPLIWDRTESSAGEVVYDLYVSEDSAAVAARSIAPLITGSASHHVPSAGPWRHGARYHWAVTARNRTLGERLDGPVWSFRVAAADAPIDSLWLPADYWAWFDNRTRRTWCLDYRLVAGPSYKNMVVWNLAAIRPTWRFAGARIRSPYSASVLPPASIVSLVQPFQREPCDLALQEPQVGVHLAPSFVGAPGEASFLSDALSAHVLAMHLGIPGYHGFALNSAGNATHLSPTVLVIYRYR